MKTLHAVAGCLLTVGVALGAQTTATWEERIQADWCLFVDPPDRSPAPPGPVTPEQDAAGGCDGVKTGEWGFHTGESEEPWWQVDLSAAQPIRSIVIWNRREAAERAAHLRVLLSEDGTAFRQAYQHDGTVFGGLANGRPLEVPLEGKTARFVRLALPGRTFLHLDEVEVWGTLEVNLALHQPATQCSTSPWSTAAPPRHPEINWNERARRALAVCERLLDERSPADLTADLRATATRIRAQLLESNDNGTGRALFLEARRLQRQLALQNPLLRDFNTLLFSKRVSGTFNHMSDQYYGWWSQPGGGLYLLRDFTTGTPTEHCLTTAFNSPGSFLRPALSYDGRKVLFAWCRHYPHLGGEPNKLDKTNVPEDAFYHLFEIGLDGSGLRQLTRGRYDDFDGRYLPDGRVVFLSTRRGAALQAGRHTAARTLAASPQPDCYVRCGGGPERPVAVYTLHTMSPDGSDLCAISPFEMFEWTPEIGRDGSILYSRWDYIDRDNMPYMGLWAIHPDGLNARIIYGNYTPAPHCTFEPKPVPGSHKIVFTASAHHAQTMGSLVLLDPRAGTEGTAPLTRLTPEVPFPEIEGWPETYYANPWPLSERFYLVAWGAEGVRVPGPAGWDRWHAVRRPNDAMALYLYDAETRTRELLWADPELTCGDPLPVRPRPRPPILARLLAGAPSSDGRFLLTDVYRGLPGIPRGSIHSLRVVAVPPKTHPTMNFPGLGITQDDPGKCVLGTVPVHADGSAYFRVPAGVIVFFQALDQRGLAVQTMRSVTHVQPGQTLGCIGCHEHREQTPPVQVARAALREPASLAPGPEGSWPLRFDQLVQPMLETQCVGCHHPEATDPAAARLNLTAPNAYASLIGFGQPSLHDQVWTAYRRGHSVPGDGIAQCSALWALLDGPQPHNGVQLSADARERWLTWLDTYAQQLGSFSLEQEQELLALRDQSTAIGTLLARETTQPGSLP